MNSYLASVTLRFGASHSRVRTMVRVAGLSEHKARVAIRELERTGLLSHQVRDTRHGRGRIHIACYRSGAAPTSGVTFLLPWQCSMDNSWFTYLSLIAALGLFTRIGSDLVKGRRARCDNCCTKIKNPLARFCSKCGVSARQHVRLPHRNIGECGGLIAPTFF